MVKTSDFVEHIQNLIADASKVKKTIKAMIEYLRGNEDYSEIHKDAILLSHDYQANEKAFISGIENDKVHKSRIIMGILELLHKIECNCEEEIPTTKLSKLHELIGFPSIEVLSQVFPQESPKTIPLIPTQIEPEKSDLEKLLVMKNDSLQKISLNSSKKEIQEALAERRRFSEEHDNIFKEKIHLKNVQKTYIQGIFEDIYTSQTLTEPVVNDILQIREDDDKFQWYDRAVIVSALTISLIGFNTFDEKKANLLIDFLNDAEDKVWQRALVGLVLALNFNPNRWMHKKQLKNKLQVLQKHPDIQRACRMIDFVLLYQLHTAISAPSWMYEKPFFAENPMNCFLPFYENNEILTANIQLADADFDGQFFTKYVNSLPLLDAYKYLLCLGIKDKTTIVGKRKESENEIFRKSMYTADSFAPFLNIISDYYHFYAYYPASTHKNMFEQKLCISQTTLKELILSKVSRYIIEADIAMNKEKNIKGAILSLESALRIESGNLTALYTIAKCCRMVERWEEALTYHLKIEMLRNDDYENLSFIGCCYADSKKYKEAFTYFEKAKNMKPDYVENWVAIVNTYLIQEKYQEAEKLGLEIAERFPNNYLVCRCLLNVYNRQDKDKEALPFAKKWLELKPNHAEAYRRLSVCYSETGNFDEALIHIEKAYQLNAKDEDILMTYGRIYLAGKMDLAKAEEFLYHSLKIKEHEVTYGNLGHLEMAKGNKQKAMTHYRKCAEMFEKLKDFEKAFDWDWQFMKKYEHITETEYQAIKDELIKHWQKKHKNKGGLKKK